MRRFIIIDPVFIEVFNPSELKTTRDIQEHTETNLYYDGETIMAPGIYLLTVSSNFFTSHKNTKLIIH